MSYTLENNEHCWEIKKTDEILEFDFLRRCDVYKYYWQIYYDNKLIAQSKKEKGCLDDYGPFDNGYDEVYFKNNCLVCIKENKQHANINLDKILFSYEKNSNDSNIIYQTNRAGILNVVYF